MTRMLVGATGPEAAEAAFAGGADIVELESPSAEIALATVAVARGRVVAAALDGRDPQLAVEILRDCGVRQIRITLPDMVQESWIAALSPVAATVELVGGMTAEPSFSASLMERLRRGGFAGAMLDTPHQAGGSLLQRMTLPQLGAFVEACRAASLSAGLAGGLEAPDIPRLLPLAPDILGLHGRIDVAALRRLIPVDGSPVEIRAETAVDHVLVEDFVLPASIGAYARERGASQLVRFAVDASVMRTGRAVEGMQDVFSYDLITDGIRMLVAEGHVRFVETLAERIASLTLAHPRVRRVKVRVQKLQTGSGTVGVEIERIK
jgi:dihydroneopterin aldolase